MQEPTFAIEVGTAADGGSIVAVRGEIDLATVGQVRSAVEDALRGGDVVVDLRAVEFMDSSGIAALEASLRLAGESGRALTFCSPLQPAVEQVLELTGMLAVLRFEPS